MYIHSTLPYIVLRTHTITRALETRQKRQHKGIRERCGTWETGAGDKGWGWSSGRRDMGNRDGNVKQADARHGQLKGMANRWTQDIGAGLGNRETQDTYHGNGIKGRDARPGERGETRSIGNGEWG
jgi:hypothetical protein